jgi:hypothetical protein
MVKVSGRSGQRVLVMFAKKVPWGNFIGLVTSSQTLVYVVSMV